MVGSVEGIALAKPHVGVAALGMVRPHNIVFLLYERTDIHPAVNKRWRAASGHKDKIIGVGLWLLLFGQAIIR